MILLIFSLFPALKNAESFALGNIDFDENNNLSVTYQNLYSIPELQTVSVSWIRNPYAVFLSHFGTQLYREVTIGGGYKIKTHDMLFTIKPQLLYLSQSSEVNFGLNLNLTMNIEWNNYIAYISAIHPISWIRGNTIPMEMELCALYNNEWNSIGFRLNFLEGWGIGLGFAYQLKFNNFRAGIGILTNPLTPTMGFSLYTGSIGFSAGFQNHKDLGLSQTFTINYILK